MGPEVKTTISPFPVEAKLGSTPAQRILQPENDGTPRGSVIDREGNRLDFFVPELVRQEKAMIREALGNREGKTTVDVSFSGLQEPDTPGEKLPADNPTASAGVGTGENSAGVASLDVAKKRKEALALNRISVEQYALAAGISTLLLITGAQQARAGFWESAKGTAIETGVGAGKIEVDRWIKHRTNPREAEFKSARESVYTGRNLASITIAGGTRLRSTDRAFKARMEQIDDQVALTNEYNLGLQALKDDGKISQKQLEENWGKKGITPLEELNARYEARGRQLGTKRDQERSLGDNLDQAAASGARSQVNVAAGLAVAELGADANADIGQWKNLGRAGKRIIDTTGTEAKKW